MYLSITYFIRSWPDFLMYSSQDEVYFTWRFKSKWRLRWARIAHLDETGHDMLHCIGCHIRSGQIRLHLAILLNFESLSVAPLPHIKFHCNSTYILGVDVWRIIGYHCGSHLVYQNIMILARAS